MTPSVVDGLQHLLIQIVHFYESNAGGIVYATHDRGVVTRWQLCDDCRLPPVCRRQPTGDDIADLVCRDNSADYHMLLVIIASD